MGFLDENGLDTMVKSFKSWVDKKLSGCEEMTGTHYRASRIGRIVTIKIDPTTVIKPGLNKIDTIATEWAPMYTIYVPASCADAEIRSSINSAGDIVLYNYSTNEVDNVVVALTYICQEE